MISGKDIQEFIIGWEAEFSETLSLEEAQLQASLLLRLYMHLVDPISYPLNTNRPNNS
jgi:hypothetical protein